jgi:hypothetical protein
VDLHQDPFDSSQLAFSLWHFDSQALQLEDSDVALDHLALKVIFVFDVQGVLGTQWLDLVGGFNRVVFEAAVRTFERFEDNIAEKGDSKEQKSCSALKLPSY